MPELPDVEVFKQYLDATALHQKIEQVVRVEDEMLEAVSVGEFKSALGKNTFHSTRRHGKYLFVELDSNRWLVLHFGMTGFLKYFKDLEKKPPHERLLIRFANGYHLAYDCQRKLGLITLVEDVKGFIAEKKLGPDPLVSDFDFENFRSVLGASKAYIKSALMNQKHIAGIGNVYSDEILFQAGVHPRQRASRLDDGQVQALCREMMETVLPKSVEARAMPEDFPPAFLIPHRKKGGACPRCRAELRHDKISGRTAHFCPKCQKKKGSKDSRPQRRKARRKKSR